jgi:dihydroneopterin aldolase
MDEIVISDLRVHYRVGVPEEERAQPQALQVSVVLGCDMRAAAASDDIADTIDYHRLVQTLFRFGDHRSWKLIESLAGEIADMILREFSPQSVWVEVKKFIIPEARHVAVRMRREKG